MSRIVLTALVILFVSGYNVHADDRHKVAEGDGWTAYAIVHGTHKDLVRFQVVTDAAVVNPKIEGSRQELYFRCGDNLVANDFISDVDGNEIHLAIRHGNYRDRITALHYEVGSLKKAVVGEARVNTDGKAGAPFEWENHDEVVMNGKNSKASLKWDADNNKWYD